tara:strand:+ start:1891 stop:2340 length:450 start_codon:yes stop_codon:yes gene_type:complete
MADPDLKTDVELLKRDVSNIQLTLSKLDTAIDKIADVSNGISKILAVHDESILFLKMSVEERKRLSEKEIELLHKRMSEMKDENIQDRKTNQEELLRAIKELDANSNDKIVAMSHRVDILERWKWAVVVGASVAGFFLSKMDPFTAFFG